MGSFLKITSAHGLKNLTEYRGKRKLWWTFICLTTYLSSLWAAVVLYDKFMDPTNTIVKSMLDVTANQPGKCDRKPLYSDERNNAQIITYQFPRLLVSNVQCSFGSRAPFITLTSIIRNN